MRLFLKECKAVLKSPVNYIYIFFLCAFFFMGYIHNINTKIEHNYYNSVYDMVPDGDDNKTIANGVYKLLSEYLPNKYDVYKYERVTVNLSDKKQARIYNILLEICGNDFMEKITANPAFTKLESVGGNHFSPELHAFVHGTAFDVGMDRFYRLMMRAGSIIGSDNGYLTPQTYFVSVKPATPEESRAEYNKEISGKFLTQDGVSGGLARLFAHFMSIVCLLLGGIVSVFYLLRDKKSDEVLAVKAVSSVRLFITKYIAVNAVLILPVLILAVIATIHAGNIASDLSAARFDMFAFFRLSILWVLPTNMAVTVFSMLVTAATDTPFAVMILAAVWFWHIRTLPVTGAYGLYMMMIRFNSELSLDMYRIARTEIIVNRLFYTGISLILVCVSVGLYHLKRGGKWNVQNLRRSLQKKS